MAIRAPSELIKKMFQCPSGKIEFDNKQLRMDRFLKGRIMPSVQIHKIHIPLTVSTKQKQIY